MSEKTEEPTPRKLRRAREEGDSAISSALVSTAGLLVAVVAGPAAMRFAVDRLEQRVETAILEPSISAWPAMLAADVTLLTAPVLAVAAVAALVTGLVQTGGVLSFKRLNPDLGRADPFRGMARLLSWERVVSVFRSLAAAVLVAIVAGRLLADHGADLAHSVGDPPSASLVATTLSWRLFRLAALIAVGLAIVDIAITRRGWLKRQRMTKDEVKREFKEAEGDPQIRAARTRAHREAVEAASLGAIKDATVVVVNPTHLATALSYDEDRDEAPRIVARGDGAFARRIVDAARAYGVPVVRDVPIARALFELEVGDEIPEALYESVAEILKEIYERAESDDR